MKLGLTLEQRSPQRVLRLARGNKSVRFTLSLAAAFVMISLPVLASFDNPYVDDGRLKVGVGPPDNSTCVGIDSCMNVTTVPPCPAMGGDASKHSWALWKANFPGATQCVIGGFAAVIVDVPEK